MEAQSDCIECNEPKVKKLVMRESSLQSSHCLCLKGTEGRAWFLELLLCVGHCASYFLADSFASSQPH